VDTGRDEGELDLFEALDPASLADLRERGRERTYRSGSVLIYEGQLGAPVPVVVTGRVRVTAMTAAGRDLVLSVRTRGAILGEIAALDGTCVSATHTAIDDVRAIVLSPESFHAFLMARPEAAIVLLRLVGRRLRDGIRRRVEFTAADTPGRVAARLVELATRFGVPQPDGSVEIALPLSQEELATWVGASREATVKALTQLRERGVLETGRRRVRVIDPAALRARALVG
jgi:CRP/FNR family transcriptional regulator, cyclic AMP receptor protein